MMYQLKILLNPEELALMRSITYEFRMLLLNRIKKNELGDDKELLKEAQKLIMLTRLEQRAEASTEVIKEGSDE